MKTSVLHRKPLSPTPLATHGQGVYLYADGRKYLDAASGAYVASIGHGCKDVVEAIAGSLQKIAYVNGNFFTSESTETLASALADEARVAFQREFKSFFLCSGSEATEAAIKFARQYHVARGETKRAWILTRRPGYHGNTLYAMSVSGRQDYKECYQPLLAEKTHFLTAPYVYRNSSDPHFYEAELEAAIKSLGSDTIAAFIAEPIIGSSAGAAVPPEGYFERIQNLCKRHGILTIADEVLTGVGRTGSFFASPKVGFKPDLITLGKGLGGGYAPVSALMIDETLTLPVIEKMGGFYHSQTYVNAPLVTAAGNAVLAHLKKNHLIENSRIQGEALLRSLRETIGSHPNVGNLSGKGLLIGIEFVENGQTPFSRSQKIIERHLKSAMSTGFTFWPNSGHVDGSGDLMMLAPPLSIRSEECAELVGFVKQAIQATFKTEV